MAEPVASFENGAADAVFLDILMERVEEDFAVRAFHAFGKCDAFGSSVHHELLEAIHDFDAEKDVVVFRSLDRLAYAFDGFAGASGLPQGGQGAVDQR